MNGPRILLLLVLADFAALTAFALYEHGYVGFFELAIANSATIQVSIDLVIALVLVTIWMIRDARERGINVVPYLAITLFAGSFGPLLYLYRRFRPEESAMAARAAHAL